MRQLGIMKAMGWTDGEIALRFWVFGLSVFIGAALGFGAGHIAMPFIYDGLTLDTLTIQIHFHAILPILLVIVPAAVYSLLACGYAYLALRRPVNDMLKGRVESKIKKRRNGKEGKERDFLLEMSLKTLGGQEVACVLRCVCLLLFFGNGANGRFDGRFSKRDYGYNYTCYRRSACGNDYVYGGNIACKKQP